MAFIVDIVTGTSQGIGRAIAESIAYHRSLELANSSGNLFYSLVLVGRDMQRDTNSAEEIQRNIASDKFSVLFEPCDLSDYKQVCQLKDKVQHHVVATAPRRAAGSEMSSDDSANNSNANDSFTVGILVNNAAECPVKQQMITRPQVMVAMGTDRF